MRFIALSLFATLLSAPAFAADLGTYRPGTPYNSVVAGGADVCDNQCAGDAQCRGWNYVKPNPRAAGVCEFLSSVSAPISSQISISGESQSASAFSSRVSTGETNTTRIGTPSAPKINTTSIGQSASRRNVIRQAPAQRIAAQQASTRPVENLSLTEQQNRYRNAQQTRAVRVAPQTQAPQARFSQPQQAYAPAQRQMFRPILDGAPRAVQGHAQVPQTQPQRQASRRTTGPRNVQQGQGRAAPQFQDPRQQQQPYQGHNVQGQPYPVQPRQASYQGQSPQQRQQAPQYGHSRPPVGQPIPAAKPPTRPQPSTPSQRLAQLTAQTPTDVSAVPITGPIALNPEQAKKSLFGSLNDDLPTASAVPTLPVTEQPLGEVLAGGL